MSRLFLLFVALGSVVSPSPLSPDEIQQSVIDLFQLVMPRGPNHYQPTEDAFLPYDVQNTAASPLDVEPRPSPPSSLDLMIDLVWDKAQPGRTMRELQRECLRFFASQPPTSLGNRGLLLIAPTGWGKSVCFLLLPALMTLLHPRADNVPWKILVIQPFKALLASTVYAAKKMGFDAEFLGNDQHDQSIIRFTWVCACNTMCVCSQSIYTQSGKHQTHTLSLSPCLSLRKGVCACVCVCVCVRVCVSTVLSSLHCLFLSSHIGQQLLSESLEPYLRTCASRT
jgi:hypothetical protein